MPERTVGKTKDVGWQIGVSRTMPVELDTAWRYLMSARGIRVWLGAGLDTLPAIGDPYRTEDGTSGEVRSIRARDRVRITWQPPDRPTDATVQIALSPAASGCTFRFHTERLADADEREAMREHWKRVADEIADDLADDAATLER